MQLPSRKFFLAIILGSLVVTAILGIVAILTSALGEVGSKVLITTVAVDIAAVLALCCAGKSSGSLHRAVQIVGLTSAVAFLVLAVTLIWVSDSFTLNEGVWRALVFALIVAIAAAHSCLLLPALTKGQPLRILTLLTLASIWLVAELLVNYVIFPEADFGDGYTKAIAVILILDVLGTIAIPLVRKFGGTKSETAPQSLDT